MGNLAHDRERRRESKIAKGLRMKVE